MNGTFTQAKDKTTSAAHSVTEGVATVRAGAARLAHRAAHRTSTGLDRAQHQAAASARKVHRTARGTAAGRTAPTRTLVGLATAAAVAVLAWLGLRGRVD